MNGKAIKILLIEKGLTQRDMCAELGVTETFMLQVIAGEKEPSLAKAKLMAEFLDATVDSLL